MEGRARKQCIGGRLGSCFDDWVRRGSKRVDVNLGISRSSSLFAARSAHPHGTMQNVKNVKLPSAGVIAGVVQTVVFGGGATYGLYNSLFNVEGGHRAIVYNRVLGIKDKVRHRGD
jgi:hypothetical protein|tara:strand:- start:5398 stop:5745 length:348 start_codon:yes stop_codon:yes gene_type:complete